MRRLLALVLLLSAALAAPGLAAAETTIKGSGPLEVALAPGTTVEKAMLIERDGPVGSVAVWVRATGARTGDLTLTLVAPDGRERVLSRREGGTQRGLGTGSAGCAGPAVIFTDEGFSTLDGASRPYSGWVQPHEPLAALEGMPSAGRWTLRLENATGGLAGTLACWRLQLSLDVDTTVTERAGGTAATVTFRELDSIYSRVRLRIAGPGGAALSTTLAQVKCEQCPAAGPNLLAGGSPLTVRDLDADGEPEVLLDLYTGGAHCCSVSLVFRRVGMTYRRSVAWWGNPGYRLADLDRDGRPELLTADDTFGYLFTSWASSGEPLVVLRYERGRLVDVTRSFPRQVQADADRYRKAARQQLKDPGGEARGLLSAWAASMANLGKAEEAFATLAVLAKEGRLGDREQMGTAANAKYVAALRAHLRKQGYLAEAAAPGGGDARAGATTG
jgi:subtilisin-like proprotein convertase family protein